MSATRPEYNVIAIGAGAGGLVTTGAIATLGGRAALIERNKMGGDCLNFGCVPSKALIASARLAQGIREARRWGFDMMEPRFDLQQILASMREQRAAIAPNDSQERFEQMGVDVIRGEARFRSAHEIEVNGEILRARHIVISAGSRPVVPPIEGLEGVRYFTNETIFDELHFTPRSLLVIGGGPIGFEWAIRNLATVPVVALALGPCAGLGAARVAMSHYSVMVEGMSQVFVADDVSLRRRVVIKVLNPALAATVAPLARCSALMPPA